MASKKSTYTTTYNGETFTTATARPVAFAIIASHTEESRAAYVAELTRRYAPFKPEFTEGQIARVPAVGVQVVGWAKDTVNARKRADDSRTIFGNVAIAPAVQA